MRVLILAAVLALVSPPVQAQSRQDHASCSAADDTPETAVISECTRLLDTSKPDQKERASIYHSRGSAYWRNGDFNAAIADENEAVKIDPGLGEAYMRRGAAYIATGEHDRAIADSTKAIEIDPMNARAYSNRGLARERIGDHRGAMADEDKAIALDPKLAAAYIARHEIHTALRQQSLASADLDAAIRIEPEGGFLGYRARGTAYQRKGDFDNAIADFDRWIAINPDSAEAHEARAYSYLNKKNTAQAIADASKAIELNPKRAFAYRTRGLAHMQDNDIDLAVRRLQRNYCDRAKVRGRVQASRSSTCATERPRSRDRRFHDVDRVRPQK